MISQSLIWVWSQLIDQKWKEMNNNAIANLHLALVDEVLSSIAGKTTTKKIWDTLVKLYEITSLHTRIFLKGKIYTLWMSELTSVTNHINNLNMLFAKLSTTNYNIVENEHVKLLLQSLLYSYDQLFINVTNYNIDGNLHFEDVVGAILEEESKRKNKVDMVESPKQAEALVMMRYFGERSNN